MVISARGHADSARRADCTCHVRRNVARSWCVATTVRPRAVSVRRAPPVVRTGQCLSTRCQNRSGPLHLLSEQASASPPAVRTGQCLHNHCQSESHVFQLVPEQMSAAPVGVRTGPVLLLSVSEQVLAASVIVRAVSEAISDAPVSVRTGPVLLQSVSEQVQCCLNQCQSSARRDKCFSSQCQNRSSAASTSVRPGESTTPCSVTT